MYFSSPQQAVSEIAQLLRGDQLAELCRFYAIDPVQKDLMATGDYFQKKLGSGRDLPGGFGKYVQPFPPAFQYFSHEETGNKLRVTVFLNIDQGDGMVQQAFQDFFLIKSEKGYQLAPDDEL